MTWRDKVPEKELPHWEARWQDHLARVRQAFRNGTVYDYFTWGELTPEDRRLLVGMDATSAHWAETSEGNLRLMPWGLPLHASYCDSDFRKVVSVERDVVRYANGMTWEFRPNSKIAVRFTVQK
jgi:hypothetical protein